MSKETLRCFFCAGKLDELGSCISCEYPDDDEPNFGVLNQRRRWMRLQLQRSAEGWWDIVLRIDGAYRKADAARVVLEYFAETLRLPADLMSRGADESGSGGTGLGSGVQKEGEEV